MVNVLESRSPECHSCHYKASYFLFNVSMEIRYEEYIKSQHSWCGESGDDCKMILAFEFLLLVILHRLNAQKPGKSFPGQSASV